MSSIDNDNLDSDNNDRLKEQSLLNNSNTEFDDDDDDDDDDDEGKFDASDWSDDKVDEKEENNEELVDDDDDEVVDNSQELDQLKQKNNELASKNEELVQQLQNYSNLELTTKERNLDPGIIKFLEDNRDLLTLEFLEGVHKRFIEFKASNPNKDFTEHIKELQPENLEKEKEKLRVKLKEAEIKYRQLKQDYETELTSFNDTRIEHIFRNSGAKDYLDSLKERIKLKEKMVADLRETNERKAKERAELEERYHYAQQQADRYAQEYQKIKAERETLEVKMKANERRMLNQTMNLSTASSLLNDNQPIVIPNLDYIPSINDVLPKRN